MDNKHKFAVQLDNSQDKGINSLEPSVRNIPDTQPLSDKIFITDSYGYCNHIEDVRLAVQKLKENIVSRFNNDANVVMNWEFILNEEIDKIFGSKLIQ